MCVEVEVLEGATHKRHRSNDVNIRESWKESYRELSPSKLQGLRPHGRDIFLSSYSFSYLPYPSYLSSPSFLLLLSPLTSSFLFFSCHSSLKQLFQPFGRITQVKVVRNKSNNESLTYGFVMFANIEDATQALEALNGYSVYGKHIKVSLARRRDSNDRTCKLYVTRIPHNFTSLALHELFSQVTPQLFQFSLLSLIFDLIVWKYC